MKIKVFKGMDGQWYWHILASNGKKMCQSEGYKKKATLLKTLKSLKAKLKDAPIVID